MLERAGTPNRIFNKPGSSVTSCHIGNKLKLNCNKRMVARSSNSVHNISLLGRKLILQILFQQTPGTRPVAT